MKPIRVDRSKLMQCMRPGSNMCKWDRLLKTVIRHDPTIIAVFDRNMNYLFVSEGFKEQYNLKEQEIIGENHYALFPSIPSEWREIHRRTLEGETITNIEDQIIRADGTVDYLHWESHPWYENDNTVGGIILFIQIITELKQAEEARREKELLYHALLDQASEALFVHDVEGKFTEVNQEACESLGYSKDELLGMYVSDVVKNFDTQKARALWHKMKQGRPSTLNAWHRRKDGSHFPVEVRIGCILWKGGKHILVLARDITERKMDEKKIIEARSKAEEANRIKTQFLANMSHELRTPLNGLMGMLQLLELTRLDEEQNDYVDLALQSSMALTDIVNDILNYTSLEKHQFLVEVPFSPETLLKDVVELHRVSSVRKELDIGFSLSPEVPKVLVGDRYKIKQILNNLMGNAVKFTESGSVHLVLDAKPSVDPERVKLEFRVTDTGRGIPADRIDHIFGIFNQADDSDTRTYGGIGLGLTIAKRLTEILKGKISVESLTGQGSSFTVICEMKRGSEAGKNNELVAPNSEADVQTRKVLVVDNDEAGRTVASAFLEKVGIRAELAENGQEALELIGKNSYDLILMDLQMPVMNGYETTKQIRSMESNDQNRIPILALTAQALPGVQQKCLDAGMDDYLLKPFQFDVWREKILFWINKV